MKKRPNDKQVPQLVLDLVQELQSKMGEGVFRVPGSVGNVKKMEEQIDKGMQVSFAKTSSEDCASLLKHYLKKLPDPLIPNAMYAEWVAIVSMCKLT